MNLDPFVWPAGRLHPLDAAWIVELDRDLERAQQMLRVPLEVRPWPDAVGAPASPAAAPADAGPARLPDRPARGTPASKVTEAEALQPGAGGRLLGAYARRALRSSATTEKETPDG